MAELGQQTVEFSTLVNRAAEESFLSLKEVIQNSKSPQEHEFDAHNKISLLKFLLNTRQRMLRLNVLAKWCQQVPLTRYCQQLASTLSSHHTCFSQAADSLFFVHEGLHQARAPLFDVPSAIEILLTGTYQRLLKCIEDVGMHNTLLTGDKRKLDTLVRSRLLELSLPKQISELKVSNGTALLRVDGEFQVLVTLGYRGHLSLWRILHLELLLGDKSGPLKIQESQRRVLEDYLERRMAVAADNPFVILYSILHEICVSLVMDTIIRQLQALRLGRWKDAIKFDGISDGSTSHGGIAGSTLLNRDGETDPASPRTPGFKILYWFDHGKGSGSCPYLKVEQGPDLLIKCHHSTFVVDPLTGREAEFHLDQSCIDIERLLLRAIFCNRYTRLHEIQKELEKNVQICRAAGDVVLQSHTDESSVGSIKKYRKPDPKECEGKEVLRVRAYGSSYFTLGMNIRNGRFLLQSSQNTVLPYVLSEYEEAMNQGSTTAVEVFLSLKSKSILHIFASVGRFLGLEVFEQGFASVKVPKNILSGSAILLMGFPDTRNSYFLLMQLDKDFKPLFALLETKPDPCQKGHSYNELNNVIRIKNIDTGQMQIFEDELKLSLLGWGKALSFLPNAEASNFEQSLLSEYMNDGCMQTLGSPSSFSSAIDEVFEVDKRASVQNLSSSSFSPSPASHLGSIPIKGIRAKTLSPRWEGSVQLSQVNNAAKVSNVATHCTDSLYLSSHLKSPVTYTSVGSLSSIPGRNTELKKISATKSYQDLASLSSSHSVEVCSKSTMDEHMRLLNDTLKDATSQSSQLISLSRLTGSCVAAPSSKPNGPRRLPSWHFGGSLGVTVSNSITTNLVSQASESVKCRNDVILNHDQNPRKRIVSDMLSLIPSLRGVGADSGVSKRRKVSESAHVQQSQALIVTESVSKTKGCIDKANQGNAPSSIYVLALLHVVRHCSLCIKHARLTSQMKALDIPYVEEVGLRSASLNIWFQLPCARGDSWQAICLRLGRPGSMYWDVKIIDQHFRDVWELHKESNSKPWGCGVRIANTSDIDSHIRYDPEGVVLSYSSVKSDSIKMLVADIQRLCNARMFALGMRRLLGIRAEEKPEESSSNSDVKAASVVATVYANSGDKLSEQMRRSFKIEAVGLTSLWFSFGSGVLARFVVEWESGKEGCTMHISPNHLWPHTKFLEDFINGAEVASLLDCIHLTAGPLHALTAVTGALSSIPKLASYTPLQRLIPGNSTTNVSQASGSSSLGNRSIPRSAMLAAGRGGTDIVASSLFPADVSVVLCGPYWIRIIYRKHFAVDMRCFAGDQVWLQPATPPKGGPCVGGSLSCPQFCPFIMERVAQELNGLEPNYTVGQQTVGPANSNNPNIASGSQQSVVNGSRVNLPSSAVMSRAVSQVTGLNQVANAFLGSSNLFVENSRLPVRRSSGTGVPAQVRGELNTAIIGLGDDGVYGGGWVPHVTLKKVLRGILKHLGMLWLFAQLPDLLKEILGSILKDNEGALLSLDQEQPALRFFVGRYVFAVSVHRVQLLLQVHSVKRVVAAQEELTQSEIGEICDYFRRRVASEPYDASRVASFITLLTLPVSVLREFLKLITWKKGMVQSQSGDTAPAQKPRIELCLENHAGLNMELGSSENYCTSKSNIHYDRPHNSVDFALTVVLDRPTHIPHVNAAGGGSWLPYCVSVRLRYSFGENSNVSFLGMEGSHGGRSCWLHADDWEKCKQRVARTVELNGMGAVDDNQGRLRIVADSVQRSLHLCVVQGVTRWW